VIGNVKKRVTWSQNSLYVWENIVSEDDFEESAVKMISPFEYEISAISCSECCMCISQNWNLFTYSATGLANRNIIHNEGSENFHKQELKLNYLNKTKSAYCTTVVKMQTEDNMQTADFLRIFYSHFLYIELVLRLAWNIRHRLAGVWLARSLYKWKWEYDILKKPAVYILPMVCSLVL